jgi:hypothetical protein
MKRKYAGMPLSLLVILIVLPLESGKAHSDAGWYKFSGEYDLFSGEIGEKGLPTSKDAKVGMHVSGAMASRMYQYLGTAARANSCSDEDETRAKGDLVCVKNKVSGKAECYFGLNLRSGKSIETFDC